jgi:hypothetical protein
MRKTSWRSVAIDLGMLALALLAEQAEAGAKDAAKDLTGVYRTNAMEIGGGLMLGADGTFDYGLSYGAIDELASGTWRREGDSVFLTTEPAVKQAELSLVARRELPEGITVGLELPEGLSRQYFSLLLSYVDGRNEEIQLGEQGLTIEDPGKQQPVSVRLILPIYSLASEVIPVPRAKGISLGFRFVPNDLGKADFKRERLKIEDDRLILERFSRQIEFVRE